MALDRKYLPTLDGWRAIAILAVLCCHARWPNEKLSVYGAMGVSVFFALSGFLITRRLMDEGRINLKSFYVRRAFRILPPMVLYLAVVALLGLAGRAELLASLLFYRNYLSAPAWYTGHFWSLAVEEHFYLLWPALLVLAGFRRARWIAPAIALLVAIWRVADIHYAWVARFDPLLHGSVARTDFRLDTLLFGCLVALVWEDAELFFRRIGGTLLVAIAMAAAVFFQARQPFAYLTWVAIFMALLPAATVSRPDSWAGRFLEWKPLAWIGRLSYSLYIWQQLFMPSQSPWRILAIFACAMASYYMVEQPAIALGRSLLRGRLNRRNIGVVDQLVERCEVAGHQAVESV